MASKGYDSDLAAKIGQLCYDMQDHCQAGRYWLLSNAQGQPVDEAIALFLKYSASEPSSIDGNLPRTLLLSDLQDYPHVVRLRLDRLGLEEAVLHAARSVSAAGQAGSNNNLLAAGCFLMAISLAAVFLIGLGTIVHWLFF